MYIVYALVPVSLSDLWLNWRKCLLKLESLPQLDSHNLKISNSI